MDTRVADCLEPNAKDFIANNRMHLPGLAPNGESASHGALMETVVNRALKRSCEVVSLDCG
jgi:hypothetical protein